MRKIAANLIITNTGKALKNSYIELDATGRIIRVTETDGQIPEIAGLEYYSGVLIPAFIHITEQNVKPYLTFEWMNETLYSHKSFFRKAWLLGTQAIGISTHADENDFEKLDYYQSKSFILECLGANSGLFDKILKTHTLDVAKQLGIDSMCGSIEPGKTPGILLISGFDFKSNSLLPLATIERLA